MKKFLKVIIVAGIIIVILGLLYRMFGGKKPPAATLPAASSTSGLPAVTPGGSIPSSGTPSATGSGSLPTADQTPLQALLSRYPQGDTVVLGTSRGGVTVNNFYKAAIDTDEGYSLLLTQTDGYRISFIIPDSKFQIELFSDYAANAFKAEDAIVNMLGVSQQDACRLTIVEVKTSSNLDPHPMSFCPQQ